MSRNSLYRGLLRCLAGMVLGLMLAAPANAVCVAGLCSCTVSTTPVAFGTYSPLAFGNTDTTGSIKIGCGGVVGLLIPYNIAISAGGSGSYANRRMINGAYALNYNLYTDASYTTVWGDGSSATQIVTWGVTLDVLGLAPLQTHWIYGRLPGRQLTAVPGSYTDTISVTLTYF